MCRTLHHTAVRAAPRRTAPTPRPTSAEALPTNRSIEPRLRWQPDEVPGTFADGSQTILWADGMPKSLTVWIPIGDVSAAHSCMHVLPASEDPLYHSWEGEMPPPLWEQCEGRAVALPLAEGGFLLWNHRVLHWGSRASRTAPSLTD